MEDSVGIEQSVPKGNGDEDVPANAASQFPLSHGQKALWFLHQLNPNSAAYNLAYAVRICSPLHAGAFQQACQLLVDRHPALRTTFAASLGGPVQTQHAAAQVDFRVEDARAWTQGELDERLAAETYHPFDLARDFPFRVRLYQTSDHDFVWFVVVHHIVCDLWSYTLILLEVPALYQAILRGEPAALKPPRGTYAAFVQSQGKTINESEGEGKRLWAYWRKRLQGELPALDLPTDYPRPATHTDRAASFAYQFSAELTKRLRQVATEHGTNLFTLMLTALQTLLHRYTGQTDVIVGSPRAGRTPGISGVVGYFVNTLALRADLSGDPTFIDLLRRAKDTVVEDFAHGALPFLDVVEQLQPNRDLSRSPIVQVMLAWQKTTRLASADVIAAINAGQSGIRFQLAGLECEPCPFSHRPASFDLVLQVIETTSGLSATLDHNVALFTQATAARLFGHLETLLTAVASNPHQFISRLPLLTEVERQELVTWSRSNTRLTLDDVRLVHERVEEQALCTPDAVAVTFGAAALTYRELNNRANRLALDLIQRGVSANTSVGVCLERSIDMPVAILAILKAGGAYVPIDPAYPRERLAFMINDARVTVLITHASLLTRLPDLTDASLHVICLDSNRVSTNDVPISSHASLACQPNPQSPATTPATMEDLAYVLYTSGSTGQPKGVAMPHRSLANLIAWQLVDTPHGQPRTLQFAPFGFDVCLQEVFSTWCAGGELVMVTDDVRRDSAALLCLIASARIERLFLPFVALQHLAEAAAESGAPLPTTLKDICTAGEQLVITPAVTRFFQRLPGCTLHNHYGPTESHAVTAYTLSGPPETWPTYPPIGQPIPNTVVAILDAQRQPVPVGVAGELYVGGTCLARGYVNRPELTAERFTEVNGQRLYCTGDRARWLSDGNVTFLGRADDQVKIRGFRVELGEIEATLLEHPWVHAVAVKSCVVGEPTHTRPRDKRLAAYIVPNGVATAVAVRDETLRAHLKARLPDYMLPAAFVWLDALPLSLNGKVDRQALPAPDWDSATVATDAIVLAPRTPVEEMLSDIWSDVLGIQTIGPQDNFFDLGGHSLLATQVAARIREIFHIEFQLRALFEAQTIKSLAAQIESARKADAPVTPPVILPVGRDRDLPLSFSQERMWFIHQLDPNSAAYNTISVVRVTGSLDVGALQYSFNALVERHESLRTTFPAVHGRPVQVIAPSGDVRIEHDDLRGLPEDERDPATRHLLQSEAARPFDIEHGPLLRVKVIHTGEGEYVLLVAMHHIITDAWSTMVFARDLQTFYEAHLAGTLPNLPALHVQYADYACWQREWLQGQALEADLSYWRKQLAGSTPLNLTTDYPRPPYQTYRGSFVSAPLEDELLRDLQRIATSEGATTFMVGLAAFQLLLYRYTAQPDIAVGVPIANREFVQSEQLIGSLVNTLVMRTDLSGNPTFRELLRRVRDMALDAYTHQNVPFAKLVAELNPVRDMSYSPLVQVMLNMINVPIPKLRMSGVEREGIEGVEGVEFDYVEVDRGASQFDLTFTLVDVPAARVIIAEYNVDLFERATVERMFEHYRTLLHLAATQPDQPIDALPLLGDDERDRLLTEWNATDVDYDRDQTLPAAFAEQAARTPSDVALHSGGRAWTYAELSLRTNQLARHLVQLGAQPGTLVGVCMARSADAVVGILAALKAGCAYVPLDPAYPAERIAYMIGDARMPILLADNQTVSVASRHNAQVVNVTSDWPLIARHSADDLDVPVRAGDAAYVIYTSGSTGKPKGVMGTHRGILNRAHWMWRAHPFEPGDVLCQKTSLNFIDAAWEIFGPLLRGVPSVILPDEDVKDPNALVATLARHGVTRITLVPSLLKVLLDTHPKLADELPTLRVCVSSGEALSTELAHRFVQRMPHTRLLNLYGSSEASGDSTCYEVTGQSPNASVPIGKPMDNVRVYVLDATRQLAPVGVPGELFIGGDGLALGYLHQPEMTAERFVADPFRDDPGGRLFKTGDVVRFLPGGNLHYLGRRDDQIKIRGMRVATGEVESVLKQHPAVADVAVVAHEDRIGGARLVAYVVPRTDVAPGDLRMFAEAQLPGHMVPSGFLIVSALPLTPNGKLDKRALPAYDVSAGPGARDLVKPRDVVERKLLDVWQRVLGQSDISVTDSFFELGGHSLLAVQLFAEVETTFAIKLPLSTLFQSPTLESLAHALRQSAQQGALPSRRSPVVAIQPLGRKPPFFCVHAIGGGVIGYAPLAHYLGDDQPFYGLEAKPEDADQSSRERIETIACDYLESMRSIQPDGPYYLGGYSFGGTLAFEMARQLRAQGQGVALLAMFDHPAPKCGYEVARLDARFVRGFVNNLSHWWKDFVRMPRVDRIGRMRRKFMGGVLAGLPAVQSRQSDGDAFNLNRYWDNIEHVPTEFHRLMHKHLQAWEAYAPQPYDGRVTVFRTPRQPLLCSYDPHLAWDRLTTGGVDVMPISGAHRNLLEEPHVQVLAAALKDALTLAQVSGTAG